MPFFSLIRYFPTFRFGLRFSFKEFVFVVHFTMRRIRTVMFEMVRGILVWKTDFDMIFQTWTLTMLCFFCYYTLYFMKLAMIWDFLEEVVCFGMNL